MAVSLEKDFQLGIDRVSELIDDAYGSLVNHTPQESDGVSVNPPDIDAIAREVADLPRQIERALTEEFVVYRQLANQRRLFANTRAPYCEQDGYRAKFILYEQSIKPWSWYNSYHTGFSVTLESPIDRIYITTLDYPDKTRGVEVVSSAHDEDSDKISLVIKELGVTKIKWVRQVGGFKNTREVSLEQAGNNPQ